MRPGEAEFLFHFLFPQLQSEQKITQNILSAVPADMGDYKPHELCRSAGRLCWHIAAAEIWFLDAVIQRRFGEFEARPAEVKSGGDVARWYAENFARRVPLLEALSGEELATPVDYLELRNDPAVAYLNIAIRHSVHHRGQLSAYLRPMGAKVPAIYVESGDEPYPPVDGSVATGPPPAF